MSRDISRLNYSYVNTLNQIKIPISDRNDKREIMSKNTIEMNTICSVKTHKLLRDIKYESDKEIDLEFLHNHLRNIPVKVLVLF
jgi:hypothetical protein